MKKFKSSFNVYYEDTDAGGVVYYANYLKFLERARSEALFSIGLSNKKLLIEYGALLIVKSCKIEYLKSAKLEDALSIFSKVKSKSRSSFTMQQIIKKDNQVITHAEVTLVVVNKNGKPIIMPEVLEKIFD